MRNGRLLSKEEALEEGQKIVKRMTKGFKVRFKPGERADRFEEIATDLYASRVDERSEVLVELRNFLKQVITNNYDDVIVERTDEEIAKEIEEETKEDEIKEQMEKQKEAEDELSEKRF